MHEPERRGSVVGLWIDTRLFLTHPAFLRDGEGSEITSVCFGKMPKVGVTAERPETVRLYALDP